jgi:hypothetical protein
MLNRALAAALALASPLAFVSIPTALAVSSAPAEARGRCSADTYVNSKGVCVRRPVHSNTVPAGASAQCRDGTYSFSQSRRGTCSHHGGVARWL